MTTAPPTVDRPAVIAAALAEYPPTPEWERVDLGSGRYLLVESSASGAGHWLSTHPTPGTAQRYNQDQEYPEDWTVCQILDLAAPTPYTVDGIDLAAINVERYTYTDREALAAIAGAVDHHARTDGSAADVLAIVTDALHRAGYDITSEPR